MKNIKSFALGAVSSALALTLVGTALASTGALTIEVNPINVQVNGQTFQPKDAQGNSVPVFTYNGTTYAPLRALAEAYGLKVGYDAEKNMATVGETAPAKAPDTATADYSTWTAEEEKAYQEFKGMWEVEKNLEYTSVIASIKTTISKNYFSKFLDLNDHLVSKYANRLINEVCNDTNAIKGEIYFGFNTFGTISWGGWYSVATKTAENNYNKENLHLNLLG